MVVVGRCAGKEALAAVGSTSALINLLVNLFVGFSVGTNVVVARDLGAGRARCSTPWSFIRQPSTSAAETTWEMMVASATSVHTAIAIAVISGALLTVIGVTLARQLLVWTASAPDVIDLATVYLRIYFAGMPANMLYAGGSHRRQGFLSRAAPHHHHIGGVKQELQQAGEHQWQGKQQDFPCQGAVYHINLVSRLFLFLRSHRQTSFFPQRGS